MMQAFAYRHLVPARELQVAVIGRSRPRSTFARVLDPAPIKIPAGGTAHVRINVPATTFSGKVDLELSDPPEGIAMQKVSVGTGNSELLVASDAAKVQLGRRGNLIVNAFAEASPANGKQKAAPNRRRIPTATLPAIPFEIVEP